MAPQSPLHTIMQRRNGKLPSCEPCRKGKLKCDHTMPTCGRCLRLRKVDSCVYHPAPLTKQKSVPGSVPSSPVITASSRIRSFSSARTESISVAETRTSVHEETGSAYLRPASCATAHTDYQATPATSQATAPLSHSSYSPQSHSRKAESTQFSNNVAFKGGYLGSTSYAAVLAENEGMIEPEPDLAVHHPLPVDDAMFARSVDVLMLLKDMPRFSQYIDRWFIVSQGGTSIIEPIAKTWIRLFLDAYGPILLRQDRNELSKLAERIWSNTNKRLELHASMTPQEFFALCSGENVRWEIVGMILSIAGSLGLCLPEFDMVYERTGQVMRLADLREFSLRMCEATDACASFCRKVPTLNDIYIWFLGQTIGLRSALFGDQDYTCWRLMGEVVDAIVALGFHQETDDKNTPFFIVQIRKRFVASAYNGEIYFATFTGRPPRLSKRYCKLDLPLDLTSEEILSAGPELEEHLQKLDARGWNKQGLIKRASWVRMRAPIFTIREEILELTLGFATDDLPAKVEEITRKAFESRDAQPAFLYEEVDWGNVHSPLDALFRTFTKVSFLYNIFLLQRVLVKRTGEPNYKLVAVSRQILETALLIYDKKDLMRDYPSDLADILASFGIPCAAIIALELLKQDKGIASPGCFKLDRSETIQDLSVFVSHLKAVPPQLGSYLVCDQGRRFLKKVLDKILSGDQRPPISSPTAAAIERGAVDSATLFGNDADFLQWLETMDWENSSWPAIMEPLN